MLNFIFSFFSFSILFSSSFVILAVNPVYSVIFLVLTFLFSAGLLFLLQLDFIALTFIIVYVGAIAILFLFVVMMLNIKITNRSSNIFKYFPLGSFFAIIFLGGLFNKIVGFFIIPIKNEYLQPIFWFLNFDKISNLLVLGNVLYTHFFIFFLIAGLILLVSMLGAIVLTLEFNKKLKTQFLFRQLSKNPKKAIFLTREI